MDPGSRTANSMPSCVPRWLEVGVSPTERQCPCSARLHVGVAGCVHSVHERLFPSEPRLRHRVPWLRLWHGLRPWHWLSLRRSWRRSSRVPCDRCPTRKVRWSKESSSISWLETRPGPCSACSHGTCVRPNPSLDNEPGPLDVAGIVGTSFMGSGNTMCCAETGTQVSLIVRWWFYFGAH